MILLDKPLISDFVKDSIRLKQFEAFDAGNMLTEGTFKTLSEREAINMLRREPDMRVHTISENALSWIENKLSFTRLPEKIELFKNKYKFRELTRDLFPDLYYREIKTADLDKIDVDQMSFPFIIKPNIGFFSMGVHKVLNASSWELVKVKIQSQLHQMQSVYPKSVLDTGSFIIEEVIQGEEYAIDAYFDDQGDVVLLGVMRHVFAGEEDVSDRLYMTSCDIVRGRQNVFDTLLKEIGTRARLKNFSLHLEVRINEMGVPIPIEVNPLRFGAWCTSADLMHYAFGFNPYHYYIQGIKPNWQQIFNKNTDDIFSIIILDNSTGLKSEDILSFDYQKLLTGFEHPLELRKIDYHQYPMFAILFVRSKRENSEELERILHSNLKEFVKI